MLKKGKIKITHTNPTTGKISEVIDERYLVRKRGDLLIAKQMGLTKKYGPKLLSDLIDLIDDNQIILMTETGWCQFKADDPPYYKMEIVE